MKAIRRIGKTPSKRGDTTGYSGFPDMLELADGTFAVIGVDSTLIAAKHDIPDE